MPHGKPSTKHRPNPTPLQAFIIEKGITREVFDRSPNWQEAFQKWNDDRVGKMIPIPQAKKVANNHPVPPRTPQKAPAKIEDLAMAMYYEARHLLKSPACEWDDLEERIRRDWMQTVMNLRNAKMTGKFEAPRLPIDSVKTLVWGDKIVFGKLVVGEDFFTTARESERQACHDLQRQYEAWLANQMKGA